MSVKKFISPLVIGVLVMGGFLAYVSFPDDVVEEKKTSPPTPVRTTIVKEKAFPITVEALGTAKANESVTITALRTENITNVLFEDGDKVQAHQLLVQLSNTEEKAKLAELEANILEAQKQFNRVSNLARSSAASEQLLDEKQARLKALEAQLDVAQSQLDELEIRAPFAGHLGIRNVSNGSLVQPGDLITTLDDISTIKVDFSVAEGQLASLLPGQRMMASSVAYPGQIFEGKIAIVDSRIDPVSRSVLVRATIDNSNLKLRPGMLLRVTLEKDVLQTLVIPEKALVPVDERQFVFVVNDGIVSEREVEIGARKPGVVQVISGLAPGEEVVTEGTLRVQQNSRVRILNNIGV